MPEKKSPSECITQFCNCRILRDHTIAREDLWVRNGRILNPEKLFFDERAQAEILVDCAGAIIAPGFIDVQINGAFGVDFSDISEDLNTGMRKVAKGLLTNGVTSFCPTVVTSPPEVYRKILPLIQRAEGSKDGAGVLGTHIEGPFISHEKKGAHPEKYIRGMENGLQDLLDIYGSLDNISVLTLAPELPEANKVIEELVNRGIRVSLGHSTANLAQGERAVCAGATFITHLFNAMLPFHHRDPHLVGLLASDQIPKGRTVFYGMISDGIHTHPAALRIAHRTHPEGLVLVTDAIPAMGLSTGVHHIGQQKVEIKDGRAVIAGTDTLCGSIANMDECVRYFYKSTECSKEQALESASLHPAQMLGITDRKGTLNFGADADFLILDDDLEVHATYVGGEKVWEGAGDWKPIARQLSI